jgi:putative membrane protein
MLELGYEGATTVNALAGLPLLTHDAGEWGHHWWPLWLLFWAALLGTVAWLILRRRDRRDPLDHARELLAERFARGELTGEEYRARLDELQRHWKGASSGE